MNDPIDCTLHDYLEIACLYGYELEITLLDGSTLKGRALTTLVSANQGECLRLTTNSDPIDVKMSELERVDVQTKNARFTSLKFDSPPIYPYLL